jgi:hypothetical protein
MPRSEDEAGAVGKIFDDYTLDLTGATKADGAR